MSEKKSVLKEAEEIIYGDREKTYGHPSKNLQAIADMWTAYVNSATDGALGSARVFCTRRCGNDDSLESGALS